MKITIKYMAQARKATGVSSENLNAEAGTTVQDFVAKELCQRHNDLGSFILDDNNLLRNMVLIFQGDKQITATDPSQLRDGDVLTIMTPITGG